MIERDCTFPSTTAEEIIIIALIIKNEEAADAKNKQIGKKVEVKTDYPSATVGGKANTFRFSHASNAFKGSDKA